MDAAENTAFQSALAASPSSAPQDRAPYYPVESGKLISIEHPFLVQNYSRAIQSLGGSRSISKTVSVDHSATHEIALYLHPEDRGSNSVISGNIESGNVLCQIKVPKMTGRKRKRGSSGPFEELTESRKQDPCDTHKVKRLLRSLSDNYENFEFKALGTIERTHRFRTMPDFVYSTKNNAFLSRVRKSIEPLKYDAAKSFALDPGKGVKPQADLIPPPSFSDQILPFNYSYRQNPAVKQIIDKSGKVTVLNESKSRKSRIPGAPFDSETVPSKPPDDLTPLKSQSSGMRDLIGKIEACFKKRPIWTRRALINQVQHHARVADIKYAFPYVGYEFLSGPWMSTVVKYGIDPRSNPDYRAYQSITVHLEEAGPKKPKHSTSLPKRGGARSKRDAAAGKDQTAPGTSHLFNGDSIIVADGKSWQVCDITDPVLQNLLATTNLRTKCHLKTDGWYHNGTWAKARAIFKFKARGLLNKADNPTESDYALVAALPDVFDATSSSTYTLRKHASTPNARLMSQQARATVSSPERGERGDDLDIPLQLHEPRMVEPHGVEQAGYDGTQESDGMWDEAMSPSRNGLSEGSQDEQGDEEGVGSVVEEENEWDDEEGERGAEEEDE